MPIGPIAALIVLLYGLLCLVGGALGYLKAKSRASLITGGFAGIVLVACAMGLRNGSRPAAIVSMVVAVVLGARFFGTWRVRRRLMPDLLMLLSSLMTLLVVGWLLLA